MAQRRIVSGRPPIIRNRMNDEWDGDFAGDMIDDFDHMENQGQVDGDAAPAHSPFASSMKGDVPWIREGMAPWHMWGNSQVVPVDSAAFGFVVQSTNQLCRVTYKRPETWRWLFFARILSITPFPVPLQQVGLQVDFDLTIGSGRTSVTLPSFERFVWEFDSTGQNARNQAIWSTFVDGPQKVQRNIAPVPAAITNRIEQFTAQDIQLQARISATLLNNYVYTAQLEVSAYFAPNVHVRPDWFLPEPAPLEQQFGGSETAGR